MIVLPLLFVLSALEGPALLVPSDQLDSVKNVLVVDARPLADFQAGHVPGSAHLDVSELSETRNGVKGLLKPTDQLREALSKAGLARDKHIVIYSGMKTPDELKDATRLFWILDYLGYDTVSVLDGGFAKWTAEKRPVETGESKVKSVPVPEIHVRADRLASKEQVQKLIASGGGTLADLRPPDEYSGEKKAGPVAKPGHIPGAQDVPSVSFVQESNGALLKTSAIDEILKKGGMASKKKVITYCNTGRQASVGYFVMRLTGHDNVSLYDGSMTEWTADASCPVELGAGKGKNSATSKEAK